MKAVSDRVIILPNAAVRSIGGLAVPEVGQEKPKRGTVVVAGPGRYDNGVLVPMTAQVGDVVLYSKFAGTEVEAHGITYISLQEREILMILEQADLEAELQNDDALHFFDPAPGLTNIY